jgi:hypothetical protein
VTVSDVGFGASARSSIRTQFPGETCQAGCRRSDRRGCDDQHRRQHPDGARLCRTAQAWIWGVSDLLATGRGAKTGAATWGSLTPQILGLPPLSAAPTATRAAQSAALFPAAKWLSAKDMTDAEWLGSLSVARTVEAWTQAVVGERCSRISVPPLCSPFSAQTVGNARPG